MASETTYLIRVLTSNIKNAGTDANVFIDLIGTNGNTGKQFFNLFITER